MKVCYIIAAAICLMFSACQKQTATIESKPNFCTIEQWESSGTLESNWPIVNFVYNNKAYFPKYFNYVNPPLQVWIYDGDAWQVISSNVPCLTNYKAFAFTVGNKGYLCGHVAGAGFYEYDFASNTWAKKADFPGIAEWGVATFTVGNKGYVVGGTDGDGPLGQTWEYDPATDTWTKKANLPLGRIGSSGFALGNKGYIVNGWTGFGYLNSLMEYDQIANTWTFKSSFPGSARSNTQAFVIGGIAFVGGGENDNSSVLKNFYKYEASSDTWTGILDINLPNSAIEYTNNYFAINSEGYVGWSGDNGAKLKKYTPHICYDFSPTAR